MSESARSDTERASQQRRVRFSNYETVVEKEIRKAMERGDFDNLAGQGKPLNLARDPGVPREWELAFKLLKDAGCAPDWIEMAKEIRQALAQLPAPFERYLAAPPDTEAARAAREVRLIGEFRERATELNRLIDLHNLKAPSPQVHLRRVRIEDEVRAFLDKTKQ